MIIRILVIIFVLCIGVLTLYILNLKNDLKISREMEKYWQDEHTKIRIECEKEIRLKDEEILLLKRTIICKNKIIDDLTIIKIGESMRGEK